MQMELVLRFDYGSIVPWVTRLDDGRLARHRRPGHGGAAHAGASCSGEDYDDRRRLHGRGRRTRALRADHGPVAPAAAARRSIREAALEETERLLARLVAHDARDDGRWREPCCARC